MFIVTKVILKDFEIQILIQELKITIMFVTFSKNELSFIVKFVFNIYLYYLKIFD